MVSYVSLPEGIHKMAVSSQMLQGVFSLFSNIYREHHPNVGKYPIHGPYDRGKWWYIPMFIFMGGYHIPRQTPISIYKRRAWGRLEPVQLLWHPPEAHTPLFDTSSLWARFLLVCWFATSSPPTYLAKVLHNLTKSKSYTLWEAPRDPAVYT